MQYNKKNPETIQQMFSSIAKNYDRANAVLSFNMHKYWNAQLVKNLEASHSNSVLLDLCSGTGDIAFEYIKKSKTPCKIHFLDFCPDMLSFAEKKSKTIKNRPNYELNFIKGDAQEIPLESDSVDYVTVAYGIRNVKDPQKCIEDAYRVIKTGGVFGILELTEPKNPLLRFGHWIYLRTIMPILGKLVATNKEAYEYLCSSIHSFVSPDELCVMLKNSKFSEIKKIPLLGGVATILIAKK
ncbi:MAG: bifunctional demethylmenaquinone methyltransferase/2-methoxy-6-polyprenyl-1,4-benzoquinol methylase UbiE [Chlamydiota bacterium]|nr:bifunctional demethylmenaquinone methyltransferase/2-methoxy-6-polyprenyl-1,4-benzoquinol methylase UbiE [Chlamydiota bacterium]